MADVETLPPVEIPWKLASTTQPLASAGPAETTLSLFYYEPDEETLTRQFPDEKLAFFKIVASVSPAAFPRELSQVAATFLGDGIPCFHLLLDLSVEQESAGDGSIRPYFHAAAPLSRTYVQTGVLGTSLYEGEADGVAIGKSGSQMHETMRSHSHSLSVSGSVGLSLGPIGASGSVRSSTTDVASSRNVSQSTDSMSRSASEDRRELTSHTTRIENIISLLSAKYLGTPHLRFSVAPQPLQQLSVDPSDPNLWFQQLLARRSSGVEGIQEFIGLVVMPKDASICVHARLRRVCVLDSPPSPLALDERFTGTLTQLSRMANYLYRAFPPGTPLDELDIDILGNVSGITGLFGNPASGLKRPVISNWGFRLGESLVVANIVSPSSQVGVASSAQANYKHMLELWLDTLQNEYETELTRSPLERGVLVGDNRFLHTCFARSGDGAELEVSSSSSNVTPLVKLPIDRGKFDIGGAVSNVSSEMTSARTAGVANAVRWNVLETRLANLLANDGAVEERPLDTSDSEVTRILLDTWRKLPRHDARNLDLNAAAKMLGLSDKQRKQLEAAGARDLASLAWAITAAHDAELHLGDTSKPRGASKGEQVEQSQDQLDLAFSARDGAAMLDAIGKTFASPSRRKS